MVLLFVVPALLSVLVLLAGWSIGFLLTLLAVGSAAAGVVVERWLFFAEAEHVVMLFYGRNAA